MRDLREHTCYCRMDGSTSIWSRQPLVEKFNKVSLCRRVNDGPLFLFTRKNLSSCSYLRRALVAWAWIWWAPTAWSFTIPTGTLGRICRRENARGAWGKRRTSLYIAWSRQEPLKRRSTTGEPISSRRVVSSTNQFTTRSFINQSVNESCICILVLIAGEVNKYIKISIFMLCNMRSKLIPTDHIYIHKYRNVLSVDTFLNPHMYLKRLLIVWAAQ